VYLYLFKIKFELFDYKINPKKSEPTGFFFASDDIIKAEYLMIIIHGMGVVRAGQWSRKYLVTFLFINYILFVRLIINESIEVGSQLNYIQLAQARGYAVIVTNTNLNTDESSKSIVNSSRPIRVSWKNIYQICFIVYKLRHRSKK